MAVVRRTDKLGRPFWVDTETGRRAKKPPDYARPRVYSKDKRGRGFWYYLDTGGRAPKPTWETAPRHDTLGRPLDSRGRRVPASALQTPAPAGPPSRQTPKAPARRQAAVTPEQPRKRLTKGQRQAIERAQERAIERAKRPRIKVRPKVEPKLPRASLVRADQQVPGFEAGRPLYWTHGAESRPKDLARIFQSWVTGAVRKSPMMSASELEFGQFGLTFTTSAPLDTVAMQELRTMLAGLPVEVAFRPARREWQIFVKMVERDRPTGTYVTGGVRSVDATLSKPTVQKAAGLIYDWLVEEWEAEAWWSMFVESLDTIYEG